MKGGDLSGCIPLDDMFTIANALLLCADLINVRERVLTKKSFNSLVRNVSLDPVFKSLKKVYFLLDAPQWGTVDAENMNPQVGDQG